jgi:predicted nucleotidyltransferase
MTLPLVVEQEIVRRLRPLKPVKVILFGSYAKGTATEDSDIDLAVVLPGPAVKTCRERLDRSHPVNVAMRLLRRDYAMDIVVRSTEEYMQMRSMRDSFWQEIEKTGRVLYGR